MPVQFLSKEMTLTIDQSEARDGDQWPIRGEDVKCIYNNRAWYESLQSMDCLSSHWSVCLVLASYWSIKAL